MLCSKERNARLQERERNKQLKRKKARRIKAMTRVANYYRTAPNLKAELQKQEYYFSCLVAELWVNGLTTKQIAGIYNTTTAKVSRLIFSQFPALSTKESRQEQLLRTKQNWFECYELLTDYGVKYEELELFLNTYTNLEVSKPIVKKQMLDIKKLLEAGAVWDSKREFYTFREVE